MSEGLLLLHILGVAAWFGANVTQAVVGSSMMEDRGPVAARWLRTTAGMSKTLYMPAAILILVTGIALVVTSDGLVEFSDVFISIGIVTIVVGAVLGIKVFEPEARKAADALDAGDGVVADAARAKIRRFGVIDTLLMVVTVWAMVSRLGA